MGTSLVLNALATFALPALFIASGVFAMAVLVVTWRTYGRELAVLRAQLAASADLREFAVCTATTQVREFSSARRRPARVRGSAIPAPRAVARRAAA